MVRLRNPESVSTFQSTPVIANGRIADGFPVVLRAHIVSIHARYC